MKEFFYLSADGRTQIRAACWEPPCAPRAVLQLVHGMYEHMGWYDRFARWLAAQGFLVVGNDHLGHGLSVAGEENRGFFAQPNGNGCVLQDIHTLRTLTQKDHPQLPYFILGHSMGSFLTRQYIQRHGLEKPQRPAGQTDHRRLQPAFSARKNRVRVDHKRRGNRRQLWA